MRKKFVIFMLSSALIVGSVTQVMAANESGQLPVKLENTGKVDELPDSVLYYGEIKDIKKDKEGTSVRLFMDSERYGERIMNLSEKTVWIDTGNKRASNPSDLKVGERVYIFHSVVTTSSIPAQTAAFAVIRNIRFSL